MSDIFKPENKTIKGLFYNDDSFYKIPIYQRPYSWDKQRVEQLWYDIVEAYKNNNENDDIDKNYFLGSVVVVKNNDRYEIVDGQQRLTTLTILFCTLRDLNLNFDDLTKNTISNSIKSTVENKQRLETHSKDQILFNVTVIKGINFDTQKGDYQDNRFLQTALYFRELITKAQEETDEDYIPNFSNFIDYLFNKITIIQIICFDLEFAIKLFSILNDRGLELTPSDIIKASLLQKIAKEKEEGFVKTWEDIEKTCKYSKESLQNLLTLYLYYLKGKNPKKSLQKELEEQFKGKDPQAIILNIKEFGDKFYDIQSNTKDKQISMLKYLPHIYWKSILTTAKQENYSNYEELKKLITKYYYQSWIADGTSSRIKQTSFNILKKIKTNAPISEIKNLISENLGKWNSYLDSLHKENVYFMKWHKPLLLALEYNQQDSRDFIEISNNLHTEHILPIKWNKKELNWSQSFTKESANKLLNSLGNLTLLTGVKNIRASNINYEAKKEIYQGNSGKGFDGITSFEITKKIINDYPQWTEESINKRFNFIVEQAKHIFEI